jgi:putative tricarboxylic transport membrane protein
MNQNKPNKKKLLRNKPFFSGCFFLLCSGYIFYLISRFPDTATEYRTISPTFFPYVLSTILGVLSIFLMLEGRRKPVGSILSIRLNSIETYRTLALLFVLMIFSSLLTTLGFILDAFLFMVSVQLLLGERRWSVLIIVSLLVSFGMYFIFATLFKVPLPLGVWLE